MLATPVTVSLRDLLFVSVPSPVSSPRTGELSADATGLGSTELADRLLKVMSLASWANIVDCLMSISNG